MRGRGLLTIEADVVHGGVGVVAVGGEQVDAGAVLRDAEGLRVEALDADAGEHARIDGPAGCPEGQVDALDAGGEREHGVAAGVGGIEADLLGPGAEQRQRLGAVGRGVEVDHGAGGEVDGDEPAEVDRREVDEPLDRDEHHAAAGEGDAGLGAAVAVGEGREVEAVDDGLGGRQVEVVDRDRGAGEQAQVGAAVGAEGEGLRVGVGDPGDRDVVAAERLEGLAGEDIEGVDAEAAEHDQLAIAPRERGVGGGGRDVSGQGAGGDVDDVQAGGRHEVVGDDGEAGRVGDVDRAWGIEHDRGAVAAGRLGGAGRCITGGELVASGRDLAGGAGFGGGGRGVGRGCTFGQVGGAGAGVVGDVGVRRRAGGEQQGGEESGVSAGHDRGVSGVQGQARRRTGRSRSIRREVHRLMPGSG